MDEQELLQHLSGLPPDVAEAMLHAAETALQPPEGAEQPAPEEAPPAPSESVAAPSLSLSERVTALGYQAEVMSDGDMDALYVLHYDKHYHIMPASEAEALDDVTLRHWIERALGLVDWAAAQGN